MPITTDKNNNYGPPLVSQKYSPLENIEITNDNRALFSALLTNRNRLLTSSNLLRQPLKLILSNWAANVAAEVNKKPPLVVISSNRSKWIKNGIDSGDARLGVIPGGLANFTNVSDLRAIKNYSGETLSPPMYAPKRIGDAGPRNVYIVVHSSEYKTYKKNLAGTGVIIVGWEFELPQQIYAPKKVWLTGFGASRYAAIEFCKELRRRVIAAVAAAPGPAPANAPWNYAWLLDDNAIALTNFAGYDAVEAAMAAADPVKVCAGFHGGTQAIAFAEDNRWATTEINHGRGHQSANLPPSAPPGIVQQASLWNIEYLSGNHLNFGPIYITSGEDLSFVNYFNKEEIPYFYYAGITVRKEITTYDNSGGANKLNAAKQKLAKWFVEAESSGTQPGKEPPPPVKVDPRDGGDGGVQNLSVYIKNKVLRGDQNDDRAKNEGIRNAATSQGVEQTTCGAINAGFVTDAALQGTFQINGDNNQVITAVDLP